MAEGKTSVLASLTAQVMTTSDEKKKASRKLTPVEGEAVSGDDHPLWPNDLNGPGRPGGFMSHEAMHVSAVDLRRHAATLIEVADALDSYAGESTAPGGVVESIDEARARKEREADARIAEAEREAIQSVETDEQAEFRAAFEAKQKAAQAQVYGSDAEVEREVAAATMPNVPSMPPEETWRCPIHNKAGIEKKSPSSGRTFIGCPECKAFQR